jgi:hypothetical protein
MPPHRFHRARWLCGMLLWQTFYPQVECARRPGSSETLGSGPQQLPVQATLSPVVHLSKDLHLSFSKIRNREPPLRAKMSCRPLRRQEMPFLSQSIFPASGLYVPPCRSNRAGMSWMRVVAMHRMQPHSCPIVRRLLQLLAEAILRFFDDSLAVANYSKMIRERSGDYTQVPRTRPKRETTHRPTQNPPISTPAPPRARRPILTQMR